MRKRFHAVQVGVLVLIGLIGVTMLLQSQRQETSPIAPIDTQVSAIPTENPGFTTILKKQLDPILPREDPKLAPLHGSDILRRIEFEQIEYVAFLDPNDTTYPLWYLDDLQVPDAWDQTTGSTEVVIAVIDSGYALDHVELTDGWHINAGEQGLTSLGEPCWTGTPENKQTNNCDDDQNSYVDDWRGWDFYGIDNSPGAGEVNPSGDGVTHGSLVAGLIGAASNNAQGFPGVDWQAKIMPLQALSDNGNGFTSDIVAAVEYAVDNGADIVNLSLGGAGSDAAMQAAVSYARSQDVIVITSSGNCATLAYSFCSLLEPPGYMSYPALYPETIAIGATDSAGDRASFSSYGPELDVVAPGQALTISTSWINTNTTTAYGTGISGTSFSSPLVAGIAGLIKAANPDISADGVRQILRGTALQHPSASGTFDNEYGYGLVQANDGVTLSLTNEILNTTGRIDQPVSTTSDGLNPGSPLGSSESVSTSIVSYPGDQVFLRAENINTGQKVSLPALKTDENGQATLNWNASDLGDGSWRLTPNGLQLSGVSETIYIGS